MSVSDLFGPLLMVVCRDWLYTPVIDGTFIQDRPEALLAQGKVNGDKVWITHNFNEVRFPLLDYKGAHSLISPSSGSCRWSWPWSSREYVHASDDRQLDYRPAVMALLNPSQPRQRVSYGGSGCLYGRDVWYLANSNGSYVSPTRDSFWVLTEIRS